MRRRNFLAVPILSLGLFACEDGPNQTYEPATGTDFNSGGTLAVTDDASAPLGAAYAAQSKQEVCDGQELQAEWKKMVQMPIAPPRFWAGLDLAGGDQYPGLTVQQAVTGPLPLPGSTEPAFIKAVTNRPDKLCQYTVEGVGGDSSAVGGSIQVHWGNNSEVQMEYITSTQKDYLFTLNPGYTGHAQWSFVASDGNNYDYDFSISNVITKAPHGHPEKAVEFNIWTNPAGEAAAVDEILRGLISTFSPDLYNANAPRCDVGGTCLIRSNAQDGTGRGLVGIRPVSFYFFTYPPSISTKSGDTINGTYSFRLQFAPYSGALSYMTLAGCGPATGNGTCPYDQGLQYPNYGNILSTVPSGASLVGINNYGPVGYATGLGDLASTCVLTLGDTFGNLLSNCVNVFKDKATDTGALSKVLGGLTHDDQNFTFSVNGVNQNYRPASIDPGGTNEFNVVSDALKPQNADKADDFVLDVRATGAFENDTYPVNNTTSHVVLYHFDYHGNGEVMKEYQRPVQTKLEAAWIAEFAPTATAKALHDHTCFFTAMDEAIPTFDTQNFNWPAGCTGFEGMMTSGTSTDAGSADPDTFINIYNADFGNPVAQTGALPPNDPLNFLNLEGELPGQESTFKPGGKNVFFCDDPGQYKACSGVSLFDGSLARVIQVLGHGDISQVPTIGRDMRFYFRQFAQAKAEYLHSTESLKRGANIGCTTPDGSAVNCAGVPETLKTGNIIATDLDSDYFIFDAQSSNAGFSEFVDYTNASATRDPLDFQDQFILPSTNLQQSDFFERLDREERALFNSMAVDDTQPSWAYLHNASGAVTKDDYGFPIPNARIFLSNVFGSSTLAAMGYSEADCPASGKTSSGATCTAGSIIAAPAGYVNPCSAKLAAVGKDAYYCSTHIDKDCPLEAPIKTDKTVAAGVSLLTRDNGKPLLDGYCGAFAQTAFTVGTTSPMTIDSFQPLQQTTIVEMPNFDNPFDLTTTNTPAKTLVPWKPSQEGVGYPVMADGQHDVFVQTQEFDFSGQVVTPVVDFISDSSIIDPVARSQSVHIEAVEAEDFLGDVFLCYDPTNAGRIQPNAPGDLLNVHLASSAENILAWIAAHPNVANNTNNPSNCGLIVRYSQFNNYPSQLQSSTYGVRVSFTAGQGFGVVTDATLYDPTTGSPASP